MSRRQLLTGALRLTRGMAPEVADSLAHCRELLGFSAPVEVYVRPEPVFNAGAIRNPGGGPHIIVISSRLLEVFTPEELRFVIGHEMGHMAFDHFGIPMPATAAVEDMAGQMVSRYNALRLYLWCRSAEITADRVGLVCAGDPVAAASGFFKLASGLSSPRVQTDLEAYATQVESLASAPEARSKPRHDDDTLDCFSTHPYSPLRVRAVVAFSKSRTYRSLTGQGDDGYSDDEVEAIVERDLSLMEPGYLEEKNEESTLMRRMLYCAGVSVAAPTAPSRTASSRPCARCWVPTTPGVRSTPRPPAPSSSRSSTPPTKCRSQGAPSWSSTSRSSRPRTAASTSGSWVRWAASPGGWASTRRSSSRRCRRPPTRWTDTGRSSHAPDRGRAPHRNADVTTACHPDRGRTPSVVRARAYRQDACSGPTQALICEKVVEPNAPLGYVVSATANCAIWTLSLSRTTVTVLPVVR
ncbi:MAG: M48 family metallopeptidase [Deltaproteobacteria bacterium]|nr:M48 family metallopeptidase [Deltaproteobacteria bacterium]